MPVRATNIFEFLAGNEALLVERREIASIHFSALRRNLRIISASLREGDLSAQEVSIEMQRHLMEWQTVPIEFDAGIGCALGALGPAPDVERRWGPAIRIAYEAALDAAQRLRSEENPARTQIRDAIRQLRADGRNFKIYCHKLAKAYFRSIPTAADTQLTDSCFLHSPKQYRDAEPFDVLIKMGPLRSFGWASCPDAIIAAPRFSKLIQIVWTGCADEPGFGYDPATGASEGIAGSEKSGHARGIQHHGITIRTQVTRAGNDIQQTPQDRHLQLPAIEEDDFQFFQSLGKMPDRRSARLVQIDEEHGILYPSHSNVASYDPATQSGDAIGFRVPGETLLDGMYVIIPLLGDVDLGGVHAGDGKFSQIWKARLREELHANPDGICRVLRNKGIPLLHLRSAVENWAKPPTTVIHAPQLPSHFEILISVLGIDFDSTTCSPQKRSPWWQYAWNEIRHARGEAIQTGLHEQELVDEQLLVLLRGMDRLIGEAGASGKPFLLEIPSGRALEGALRFYPVVSIEEGFRAPEGNLKIIDELRAFEQWRV